MFDAIRFCNDYQIPYAVSGQYLRDGWVNIQCVLCHNKKHTLGIHIESGAATCYICGKSNIFKVVSAITERNNVANIVKKYTTGRLSVHANRSQIEQETAEICTLPEGHTYIHGKYTEYLISRKFCPNKIPEKYKLRAGGNIGSHKFRIIAPIYVGGILVSYQSRDITGLSQLKYKTSKKENEVIFHKNVLYNIDNCKKNSVVITEGITDVWRLGDNSVCTFGINWSTAQAVAIAKKFKQVFIFFDTEPQAITQAEKLYHFLSSYEIDCEIITADTDPGDMDQAEADNLMKDLIS